MSMMTRLSALPQFLRFSIVGALGFFVDAAVLNAAMFLLGTGPYLGRLLSYLCAATATWHMNRQFTFPDNRGHNKGREWLTFVACSSLAGVVNYLAYASYLHFTGESVLAPTIGVGLGACAALLVNYTLSRRLVFRSSTSARP